MTNPRKWLPVFFEQYGDNNDYNDSDEVLGWLGARLDGDVLTILYEDGYDNSKTEERYRVVPL